PARLHPPSPPTSLCPSESYARLRFLARSARRLRMSHTLSPATSASSPCGGLAPQHYSDTCIDGGEPDGEEHLLPSTLPRQPDRPGVHVDHPGHTIAGRAQISELVSQEFLCPVSTGKGRRFTTFAQF